MRGLSISCLLLETHILVYTALLPQASLSQPVREALMETQDDDPMDSMAPSGPSEGLDTDSGLVQEMPQYAAEDIQTSAAEEPTDTGSNHDDVHEDLLQEDHSESNSEAPLGDPRSTKRQSESSELDQEEKKAAEQSSTASRLTTPIKRMKEIFWEVLGSG